MLEITRRSFVGRSMAIPVAATLHKWSFAGGTGASPLVRYDARSANGKQMLKIYAKAVAKMQSKPDASPLSWVFQWYTHWVKGNGLNTTSKAAEIVRLFPAAGPDRQLAQDMWDTCQAHGPGMDENLFLPWHRAFLWYFEGICRAVTGESSFTLPYWDYSSPDPSVHGVIPPEFTKEGDPDFGSLYVGKRNPGVNDGQPIDDGQPADTLSTDALAQCTYGPNDSEEGFCQKLDFGLHGNVHVLVGNTKNMGQIPWAAGDPIFWLHHCNIDRLWASWNASGAPRANPTLTDKFVFADSGGTRVVADMTDFEITKDYTYDRLENIPACSAPPTVASAPAAPAPKNPAPKNKVAAVKSAPIKLSSKPVKVKLDSLPVSADAAPPTLEARVKSLQGGQNLFIVIKDLQVNIQPGVLYHIYLDLPDDSKKEQMKPHYVGSVNFFHAEQHENHGHESMPNARPERFISFNITSLAKQLADKKLLTDKPTLTIAPAGEPAEGSQPIIGTIEVVQR
jgi:tyrosinase